MIDCVTLLVRCRDIFPQVEDQLPHEFQEHVTLTQGPVKCVSIKCRVLIQFLCDGLRVYSGTLLIRSATVHKMAVLKGLFKQENDQLSFCSGENKVAVVTRWP